MISPNRLSQIKSFSTIVTALLEYRCYPAAVSVAERIFSVISSNAHLVSTLNQQDIDSFVDAIISLEIYSEAVDKSLVPEKFIVPVLVLEKFIVPVFTLLTPQQQCKLLVDLKADNNSRLRGSPACLNLYTTLTTSLIQKDFCSQGITPEVMSKVIDCHVKLNDKEIMDDFVYFVLWRVDKQETRTPNIWLENLLAAIVGSSFAKSSLLEVLAKRKEELKACLESPWEEDDKWRGELSRFFIVLLRMERSRNLADSARLESFTPIYQKMNPNRLMNLAIDLVKQGSPYMKKHSSTHRTLFKMGKSLLQRDCSSFQRELPIQALVEILKCLADFHDHSLVRLFIADICGVVKWTWRDKRQLIRTVLTSTNIWTKFIENETCAGFVRNIQTDLLRSWIAGLEVASASESTAIEFRTNVAECFLFSIREEKKCHSLRTDLNSALFPNDLFTTLFEKMPTQELASLIWKIYQADAKEVHSLKNAPTALNLYRDLCQKFVDKCDVKSWCKLPGNMLIQTTNSLLWLEDESFSVFTDKILKAHPDDEPNGVILKIAESADIRKLPLFPRARQSLRRLLELRVSAIRKVLEKNAATGRWILPEHPRVEEFLRSSAQKMAYANFSSTEKAKQFANFISSFGTANGFSLQVQTEGVGFEAICKIVKVACASKLVSEKTTLKKVIAQLKVPVVHPKRSSSDTAVVDVSKKPKLDFSSLANQIKCPSR